MFEGYEMELDEETGETILSATNSLPKIADSNL